MIEKWSAESFEIGLLSKATGVSPAWFKGMPSILTSGYMAARKKKKL